MRRYLNETMPMLNLLGLAGHMFFGTRIFVYTVLIILFLLLMLLLCWTPAVHVYLGERFIRSTVDDIHVCIAETYFDGIEHRLPWYGLRALFWWSDLLIEQKYFVEKCVCHCYQPLSMFHQHTHSLMCLTALRIIRTVGISVWSLNIAVFCFLDYWL